MFNDAGTNNKDHVQISQRRMQVYIIMLYVSGEKISYSNIVALSALSNLQVLV